MTTLETDRGGEPTLAATDAGTEPSEASTAAKASQPRPHGTFGRYVVLSKIGEGGMGVVYAAYDPELDRKVALKLLRARGRSAATGASRLLREAQALARLSHPNIVAVHDVGTVDAQLWLAMEFVQGRTLTQWLRERPRTWKETLVVFRAAAQGLVAAHDAGLVHRDFKPDNVMVGPTGHEQGDGRVRVMDFGLARSVGVDPDLDGAPDVAAADLQSSLERPLTRTGAVVGTPAYMAPEQMLGQPTDARTDQFSFCVTLWEALHGERPFAGSSVAEVTTHVLEGQRRPPARRVPAWLDAALCRGLANEPEQRWPSMQALLDALDAGRRRAGVRQAGTLLGIGLVGVLGLMGWQRMQERALVAACEEEGAQMDELWNDSAATKLRTAIVETGRGHAAVTADKVIPWLDEHASKWKDASTRSCMLGRVHRQWTEQALQRSRWCLDERRMELAALVSELGRGSPATVDNAVHAAAGLRSVEPCLDPAMLARLPEPPREHLEEVRAVREELAQARALRSTGDFAAGLEVADALVDRAQDLAWPPLVAETQLLRGALLHASGNLRDAEPVMEDAYFEAMRASAPEIALQAAEALAACVGVDLARPQEGLVWSRHAAVLLDGLGDPAQTRHAEHVRVAASLRRSLADYEEAERLYAQVVAILEESLGPDHPALASALNDFANAQAMGRNLDEALTLHERALELREASLGPRHPEVAHSLNNLGGLYYLRSALKQAKQMHHRALSIRREVLDPHHPHIAASLANLALVHLELEEYEEAFSLQTEALEIRKQALGPDHPMVAASLKQIAAVHKRRGDLAQAKEIAKQALLIEQRALGRDHPDVAETLSNLSDMHRALGELEQAKELGTRAMASLERSMGADHPELAIGLANLGRVHQALGELEQARDLYQRASTLIERSAGDEHPHFVQMVLYLAAVQVELGELAEARTLYERIRDTLDEHTSDRSLRSSSLRGLARIALLEGDVAQALVHANRALQLLEAGDGSLDPADFAEARFMLARAQWEDGERNAAIAYAEQAAAGFRDAGAHEHAGEVDKWLAARGRKSGAASTRRELSPAAGEAR